MFRKILLVICILVLFAFGAFAQDGSAATKTEKSASTADTAKKSTTFRPTKDQIKRGQQILKDKKLYTGEITGLYGDSRPAIKAYQKENGLEQNGKFDKATLEKMGIPLTDSQKGIASSSSSKSKKSSMSSGEGKKGTAPFQASKEQIMALQKVLKNAKLYSGEANGERSEELKAAVKKYQDSNGLKATGGINAATLQKAGIALTDKQKANVAVASEPEKKN